MKCVVCHAEVPDEADLCPECREPVQQWRMTDQAARAFLREGAHYDEADNTLMAALSLAKASFLQPKDPTALKALGKLLAREAQYESAAYLLEQCCRLAEAEAREDPEAERLLARLEELSTEAGRPAPTGLSSADAVSAGLLCLTDFRRKREAEEADDGAVPWETVLDLESRWNPAAAPMGEVLSWAEPPDGPHAGAWLYLRGVCALARGDSREAYKFFRRSAQADASRRNPEVYLLHLSMLDDAYAETLEFLKEEGRPEGDVARTVAIAARVLANSGRMDEAVALLEQAARQGPRSDELAELHSDFAGLSAGDG